MTPTKRQQAVISFAQGFAEIYGRDPSRGEIALRLGLDYLGALDSLDALPALTLNRWFKDISIPRSPVGEPLFFTEPKPCSTKQ